MIKLGAQYRDAITGFTGIATGIVNYITGCDQVLLAPKSRGGHKSESSWFDVIRVSQVGKKVIKLKIAQDSNSLNDNGADMEAPIK